MDIGHSNGIRRIGRWGDMGAIGNGLSTLVVLTGVNQSFMFRRLQ
jgi:hypothetical protein